MNKLLILLLSLTVLTSSCATKKVLWTELGIVSAAAPGKAYPAKAVMSSCAEESISYDTAKVVPDSSLSLPSLLAVLFIISFAFPALAPGQRKAYAGFNSFISEKVPIYLRLGRLIYYA